MKIYAAWTVLTLLVTAIFAASGEFTSTLAALGWTTQMLLLFATGDLAAWAVQRRRLVIAAAAAAVATGIVAHRLSEATQPAATAVGLILILTAGAAAGLLLRDHPPASHRPDGQWQ